MDEEQKFPVNIGLTGKVELKGEVSTSAIDRLTHALVDVVSPFTEGMGLIGDHVRAHRYDVAIKVIERAKQLAQEEKRTITPPPLKFIVPFLEKSSTESSDEELTEMWARLLIDAADEFEGVHLTYVQILSEISGFEARYLNDLGKDYDAGYDVPSSSEMKARWSRELWQKYEMIKFPLACNTRANILSSKSNVEKIQDQIYSFESTQYCKPIMVSVSYTDTSNTSDIKYASKGCHATTAYLLQRQDLLAIESGEVLVGSVQTKIELACLTPLGADFIVSCIGR